MLNEGPARSSATSSAVLAVDTVDAFSAVVALPAVVEELARDATIDSSSAGVEFATSLDEPGSDAKAGATGAEPAPLFDKLELGTAVNAAAPGSVASGTYQPAGQIGSRVRSSWLRGASLAWH